jgi:Domain of unknown function (DUF4873)
VATVTETGFEAGYHGTAELLIDDCVHTVTVRLSGRFDPLDGHYHWGGRIWPHPAVVALLRTGRRSVRLRTAGAGPVAGRLTELDPWGGVRITGIGTPPFPPSTVD